MKLFEVLAEALKPSEYRHLVKGWNKEKYKDLFKKYTDDPRAYRIYFPIHAQKREVTAPHDVSEAVKAAGYEIEDYVSGIASKDDGKRKIKIGKLLKDPKLQQLFANDPHRAASKKADHYVVISRHPYDIAGMSTHRGWKSCMNLHGGVNKHYVPLDVKEGTLVAYVVKADDKNIENPVGRILIKPFTNVQKPDEVAFGVEAKVYGTDVPGFRDVVMKWADEVNDEHDLNGVFQLNPNLYPDSGQRTKLIGKNHTEVEKVAHDPASIAKYDNPSEELVRAAIRLPKGGNKHAANMHFLRYVKKLPEGMFDELLEITGHHIFGYMSEEAKKALPLTVFEEAFKKDPEVILYISDPSVEMQKKAIDVFARKNFYYGIGYIKNISPEMVMYALKKNPNFIGCLNEPSRKLQEVHDYIIDHHLDASNSHLARNFLEPSVATIKKIYKINSEAIKWISWSSVKPNKELKEFLGDKVAKNPDLLRRIPTKVLPKDLVTEIIKKNPELLAFVGPSMIRAMVTADPTLIKHVNTRGQSKMTKIATELSWVAIKHDPHLIEYIELPSKEMVAAAVKADSSTLLKVPTRFWPDEAIVKALKDHPDYREDIIARMKKSRFYNKRWYGIETQLAKETQK